MIEINEYYEEDLDWHVVVEDENGDVSTEDVLFDKEDAIESANKFKNEGKKVWVEAYDPDDRLFENVITEIRV